MATTDDKTDREILDPVFDQAEAERLGLPPIRFLSDEEWDAMVDRLARHELGMSAEEFTLAWKAGEFDGGPERTDVMRIAMLLGLAV